MKNETDLVLESLKREYEHLCQTYGHKAVLQTVSVPVEDPLFYDHMKEVLQDDRRGEVAFFVQRENGRFILVRSDRYPDGIFRVPTGGIGFEEAVGDALLREVKEELGVRVAIHRFLGILVHQFQRTGKTDLLFPSYVFWLRECGGHLLSDATEDEVSAYCEADRNTMVDATERLRRITGPKQDWARFRARTTGFILPFLP